MRVALLVLAVLVAGCAQNGGVVDHPVFVQVGTLAAFGNSSWAFSPHAPVTLAAPSFFALDEATKRVQPTHIAPGPAMLRLEGFGEAGWALLPLSETSLNFVAAGSEVVFGLKIRDGAFTVAQPPKEHRLICEGEARHAAGERSALGGLNWTITVRSGSNADLAFTGPGPCAGLTLRVAHLGPWREARADASAP